MNKATECSAFLGIYVAERALSKFFDNITRMPYSNPDYDFICGKGFKIDVKSSCLHHHTGNPYWLFNIKKNVVADYFLYLAFDSRESLEPQHVWLIPGDVVNTKQTNGITNTVTAMKKWEKYERPLDRVVMCCSEMRLAEAIQ